jgi:hypothetical protein
MRGKITHLLMSEDKFRQRCGACLRVTSSDLEIYGSRQSSPIPDGLFASNKWTGGGTHERSCAGSSGIFSSSRDRIRVRATCMAEFETYKAFIIEGEPKE